MEAITTTGFGMTPSSSSSIYKGRGLYQIHLVKADVIRPFIPKQLKLVETFGYTLGGFYLGNYEDSSFGAFDELVVIAGIVKTGASLPCAWSSKVLVSNHQVRDYAQKELGVVSQVAKFSKKIKAVDERKGSSCFLNINGFGNPKINNYEEIHITQQMDDHNGSPTDSSCNIIIKTTAAAPAPAAAAAAAPDLDLHKLLLTSPPIKLSFPSLSGLTEYIPHQLLQYICHMETRVRVVAPAKVSGELGSENEIVEESNERKCMSRIVVESQALVAFEFNSMKMMIDSPTLVS